MYQRSEEHFFLNASFARSETHPDKIKLLKLTDTDRRPSLHLSVNLGKTFFTLQIDIPCPKASFSIDAGKVCRDARISSSRLIAEIDILSCLGG